MQPSLAGVRVLEFSGALGGPLAATLLADLGADVIKIEPPGGGPDRHRPVPGAPSAGEHGFYAYNRNKRSVVVDLEHARGREVIARLLTETDVVVDAISGAEMQVARFRYADLREAHPRLIWCSLSPYGHSGPRASQPATETCIQAMSGVMSITGAPGGPPLRVGVRVGELVGDLYAAQGAVAALLQRQRTGRGQLVEIACLDALISLWTSSAAEFLANGTVPQAAGSDNPNRCPARPFRTADDRWIHIMASNEGHWPQFCDLVGLPELGADPTLNSNKKRVQRREELNRLIGAVIATRTAAEWMQLLEENGVPFGPVYDLANVVIDPHYQARGMIQELPMPGAAPIRFFGSPLVMAGRVRDTLPPPRLGQHTGEVLAELGYTREEIADLTTSQAVFTA